MLAMPIFISSLEDVASDLYRGRAEKFHFSDIVGMDTAWKQRLSAAVDASEKSKRAISLDSGNGPGYVHSILTEGKDPTIAKLMAVCSAVPVDLGYILFGVDVSAADREILSTIQTSPPEVRAAILQLLSRQPA